MFIKFNYRGNENTINLSNVETFKKFNEKITKLFYLSSENKYKFIVLEDEFYNENTFNNFYNNLKKKYDKTPNNFDESDAPSGIIEIVENNTINNLNNEELKQMVNDKDEEIFWLKNEVEKLRKELDLTKNQVKNGENNQNNNSNNSNGIKFDTDYKGGGYDIIIDIESIKNLPKTGWKIKYNKEKGKEIYNKKKDEETIVVGIIGNGNKGKSFFLEKLSGYKIPKGFTIKTEGLSIKYGQTKDHNIAILDSAGQETPLLKDSSKDENKINNNDDNNNDDNNNDENNNNDNNNNNNDNNNNNKNNGLNNFLNDDEKETNYPSEKEIGKIDDEDIEFEEYSRDKLISEFFIQKFIIWKSDILILMVGNITLNEQKLLSRIESEVNSMNPIKQIYVIHNLQNFINDAQVEDYIENTLKKLYKIEIKEMLVQNITEKSEPNEKYFNKLFSEKNKKIMHLIIINEHSERGPYYNVPTVKFIQKELEVIKTRQKFSIIEDCKKFLIRISEEIMEENLNESKLKIIEGEKEDKIILDNCKNITLKKFIVDEMGYTLNNDSSLPKYSYYIKENEKDEDKNKYLYINIELPGGGEIEKNIIIIPGFFLFIFSGEKYGDKVIEEDKKNEKSKLLMKKNTRKYNKFKLEIKIPNTSIQLKMEKDEELEDLGDLSNDGKGVYTFKYKVILINQKIEKKKKQKIEL